MHSLQPSIFSNKVLLWFDNHGRHDLPWQQNPTQYRVWISEVMLQQTQVSTVLGYFDRFIKAFSTVSDLACASEDQVLSLWSGLGYYSRARNLHKAAKMVCNEFQGVWPSNVETLIKLPGIGRSTAGAILSLSQNIFAPIFDGNVRRVLSRMFTHSLQTEKDFWAQAELLTDTIRPGNYNQAMMDLGATLCTRTKPNCIACPLMDDCKAYQDQKTLGTPVTTYPIKKISIKKPIIHKQFLLLTHEDMPSSIWLYKRPPTGIWAGLWSLPELDLDDSLETFLKPYGLCIKSQETLPQIKHIFSHFFLYLHPKKITVTSSIEVSAFQISENRERGYFHSLENKWPGGMAAPIIKLLS